MASARPLRHRRDLPCRASCPGSSASPPAPGAAAPASARRRSGRACRNAGGPGRESPRGSRCRPGNGCRRGRADRFPEPEGRVRPAGYARPKKISADASRELIGAIAVIWRLRPEVLGVLPQVRNRRRTIADGQPIHPFAAPAREPCNPDQPTSAAQRRPGHPSQTVESLASRRHNRQQLRPGGRFVEIAQAASTDLGKN